MRLIAACSAPTALLGLASIVVACTGTSSDTTDHDGTAERTTMSVATTLPPEITDWPTTTVRSDAMLEIAWDAFPTFAFPGSVHELTFTMDRPAEDVGVSLAGDAPVAAAFDDDIDRWVASVEAPDTGHFSVAVVAVAADGKNVVSDSAEAPIVPEPDPTLPVTMSSIEPKLLSLIEWGDGPDNVGIEIPVEGEMQTPAGIVWVGGIESFVIVDRVNDRLLVSDRDGKPTRTIGLDVEGWLTDAVMLPDGERLLVAEIRRLDGRPHAVAHVVTLSSETDEVTDAVEIPVAPGALELWFDPHSGLVYAIFGEMYPFYDTRTDSFVATADTSRILLGRVTDDGQAGLVSGPDYLAATFPFEPAIGHLELTPLAGWATVGAVDWSLGEEQAVTHMWITSFPFDGSPIVAAEVAYHGVWSANNVFAVRDHDIVMMRELDDGLGLYTIPIPLTVG